MEKIIISLIQMQQQMRIFHWQTRAYARHVAFGEAYDTLSDLIDTFVEVCMGKHGRFVLNAANTIHLSNLSDVSCHSFLDASCEMLKQISSTLDPECDTDLLNIRDEMLAEVNKLKYLNTLE